MVAMSNAGKALKPFKGLNEMCKGLQANSSMKFNLVVYAFAKWL